MRSTVRPRVYAACRWSMFGAGIAKEWDLVHGKVSARLVALRCDGTARKEFNQREDSDLIEAVARFSEVTARAEKQARKDAEETE